MARKSKDTARTKFLRDRNKKHPSMRVPRTQKTKVWARKQGKLLRNTDFRPRNAWHKELTENWLESIRADFAASLFVGTENLFDTFTPKELILEGITLEARTTPCLEWIGLDGSGPWQASISGELEYGLEWVEKDIYICTHTLAWRLSGAKQTPPRGQDLSHLCDNKKCCNPKHLVVEKHGENMARAARAKKRMLALEPVFGVTPYTTEKLRRVEDDKTTEETLDHFYNERKKVEA